VARPARILRLAAVIWTGTVFTEFIGPFNVLHQPLRLSVVAWAFWAVCAGLQATATVLIQEAPSRRRSAGSDVTLATGVR
jgi:hypothetical protein